MKKMFFVFLFTLFVAGCSNSNLLSGDYYKGNQAKTMQQVFYGTITHIRPINIQANDDNSFFGSLGGAVLGGVLGHSIGGGSGNSIATAAGAIGGALAGNAIENKVNETQGVELEIKKSNGKIIAVVQKAALNDFHVGQAVRIVYDGDSVNVSPR